MDDVSVCSVESGHSDTDVASMLDKLDFGETGSKRSSVDSVDSKKGKKSTKVKEQTTKLSDDQILDSSLPQSYDVKYLGWQEAAGIWGIRYTRKPVDALVSQARKPGLGLPSLTLTISEDGIRVAPTLASHQRGLKVQSGLFPIQSVSYGVQDLVYTRVFAMITVRDTNNILEHHPFRCHAYVCDSRLTARNLTFTLATAFKLFSNSIKAREIQNKPKRFAIDLRSPEELKLAAGEGKSGDDGAEDEAAEVIDDSEA